MLEMLKVFAEELMSAEADAICGAGFREHRLESAPVAVIAECYVRGVATRIPGSTPTCASTPSRYACTTAGSVVKVTCVVATAVDAAGSSASARSPRGPVPPGFRS